ncbi:hypothetical protein C6H65_00735 [Photorhabdus luminescens]|nr:hypothetical protein C6H65_00735 [Photorhabdus luminescens]
MKVTSYSVLLFLFIYAFPIYKLVHSDHIGTFLALILLFLSRNGLKLLASATSKKITITIYLAYIFLISYSILNTSLIGSYDFSMIKTLINNLLSFLSCLIFISLFFSWFGYGQHIGKYLTIILMIQSILILLMLVFPDFGEFLQSNLRTKDELDRMATYGGIRGLGVAGSIAFGLAITMGLLGYIYLYWCATRTNISSISQLIIFFTCIISSLSAGRTAILGFVCGLIFFYFNKSFISIIKMTLKQTLYILILSCLLYIVIISNKELYAIFEMYSRYVFQSIYNYFDHSSFQVSSLEKLENMYFWPSDSTTWFFGDGKYTDYNGLYYKQTDAGYMRFLLYYGIIGSLIPYISFLLFCLYSASKAKLINNNASIFFFILIFISFIFHYKGEVVFYNVAYMKIVFIIGFYYIIKSNFYLKNKDITYNE